MVIPSTARIFGSSFCNNYVQLVLIIENTAGLSMGVILLETPQAIFSSSYSDHFEMFLYWSLSIAALKFSQGYVIPKGPHFD